MALTVHPVDGLINRLLQQHNGTSRHKGIAQQRPVVSGERVDISQEARQASIEQSDSKLESHLLHLYNPRNI